MGFVTVGRNKCISPSRPTKVCAIFQSGGCSRSFHNITDLAKSVSTLDDWKMKFQLADPCSSNKEEITTMPYTATFQEEEEQLIPPHRPTCSRKRRYPQEEDEELSHLQRRQQIRQLRARGELSFERLQQLLASSPPSESEDNSLCSQTQIRLRRSFSFSNY